MKEGVDNSSLSIEFGIGITAGVLVREFEVGMASPLDGEGLWKGFFASVDSVEVEDDHKMMELIRYEKTREQI